MRIFIVGGTQFIGPHVVRMLHHQGHQITVFHRGRTQTDLPEGVQEILGDREELKEMAAAVRQVEPDVVLDMIPRTAQDAWTLINVFRCPKRRLVIISSADVYRNYNRLIGREDGLPDPVPLVETAPLRHRLFPYRETQMPLPKEKEGDTLPWRDDYDKILVERLILSEPDMPGTVLRLPIVYGPNDPQHRMFPYLKRMLDGRPVILLGEKAAKWRISRGYVENVAAAIALAVIDPRAGGKTYNVAWTRAITEFEWVRAIGQALDWPGQIVIVPDDQLPDHLKEYVDWSYHLEIDTTRIRSGLGYQEPITREEALRRAVTWESEHLPESDLGRFDYAAEDAVLQQLRS